MKSTSLRIGLGSCLVTLGCNSIIGLGDPTLDASGKGHFGGKTGQAGAGQTTTSTASGASTTVAAGAGQGGVGATSTLGGTNPGAGGVGGTITGGGAQTSNGGTMVVAGGGGMDPTSGGQPTAGGAASTNGGVTNVSGASGNGGSIGIGGIAIAGNAGNGGSSLAIGGAPGVGGTSPATGGAPPSPCATSPCKNGGTCTVSGSSFTCSCPASSGYTGTTCETNINDCASTPCLHSGTCTDGIASYTCACTGGWSGTTCSRAIVVNLAYPTGYTKCRALAVSGNGATTVGYCTGSSNATQAVKWDTATGVVTTLAAQSGSSTATGIDDAGYWIVGSTGSSMGATGALWASGGSPTVILADGGSTQAQVSKISGGGAIVVGYASNTGTTSSAMTLAYYWDLNNTHNSSTFVTDRNMDNFAQDASSDGSVIVGYGTDPGSDSTPFRWVAGTATALGHFGTATASAVYAVSDNGQVSVGYSGIQSVRWVGTGAPSSLGMPGAAWAANSDGSIIVGTASSGTAFIWDATNGARSLPTVLSSMGATLGSLAGTEARGISNTGAIVVGYSYTSTTAEQAWVVNLTGTGVSGL